MKVIQKQPVLIAEVEMMPEEDDTSAKVSHICDVNAFKTIRHHQVIASCGRSRPFSTQH